jgi:hypothetical protein
MSLVLVILLRFFLFRSLSHTFCVSYCSLVEKKSSPVRCLRNNILDKAQSLLEAACCHDGAIEIGLLKLWPIHKQSRLYKEIFPILTTGRCCNNTTQIPTP